MERSASEVAATQTLAATADHGFLSPTTIAQVYHLHERLLIDALERLGGSMYVADAAAALAKPVAKVLAAELDDFGNYVIKVVPVPGSEDDDPAAA